ncbi:MAG TPA: DUF502 domain-containing protein [Planctomycetaceae bacterium]|nr:DUF502 domain-containing protein [Planctomycetaceae bacterium]
MRRLFAAIWKRGIISTFLAGFFVVLPVAITLAIIGWVGTWLAERIGPTSAIGRLLRLVGLRFFTDETAAYVAAWVFVLAGIWLLGLLVKSASWQRVERLFRRTFERIPIVSSVHGSVTQVVDLLKHDNEKKLEGMRVVYCEFGGERGAGVLGLLISSAVYRFGQRDCHLVYVPTSPIPMSGGILFVPVPAVHRVDMEADKLMQIYFSIGVMAPRVIPPAYHVGPLPAPQPA